MASEKFENNLLKKIQKELEDHLNGEPYIVTYGSDEDQWKGLGEDLKSAFIPFRKTSYEASEYIFIRINLNDEYLSFMDFVSPVTNIKGKSIQGIATFLTYVEAPIPETYVLRLVGLKEKFLPYEWVVNQGHKPKEIIKNEWIDCDAVLGMNEDKDFQLTVCGDHSRKIVASGLSSKQYKISFDYLNYPPGMTSIVPYKGRSFIIAKDAGDWFSTMDSPSYAFKKRYNALSTIAAYIYGYPDDGGDEGEWTGQFHPDSSMLHSLLPLMKHIDQHTR